MIEDTKAKKFTSQYYKMGVAEGVINVEITPAFNTSLM
jgi:simple sugar transport system substrate-binding protein/basic membrane protein A